MCVIALQAKDLGYDEDLDVNRPFTRFNVTTSKQVDHEGDIGLTPLTLAARQNELEITKKLLKLGMDHVFHFSNTSIPNCIQLQIDVSYSLFLGP